MYTIDSNVYYIEDVPENWDGTTIRIVDSSSDGEQVALIKFGRCYAHMFGPPNNEAYAGHPLADRGLKPYSVFMVENSSWIRQAEHRNSVHVYHEKVQFMKGKKHYIFFFHDTTFECIAHSMECDIFAGSVKSVLRQALDQI